jgi:hypothetical protein
MKRYEHVQSRGRAIAVPAAVVEGRTVVATGRWLAIGKVKDEEWLEHGAIDNPARFVASLRSTCLPVDVFTFAEPLGETMRSQPYPFRMDNAAVIRTSDIARWWGSLPQETRKNVRRAAKRGVTVRTVLLDDALARGIKRIYDESPIRQERAFWHYGKDLAVVKRENASYLERGELIGAYLGDELIGFMKWIHVGDVARIMQVLTLNAQSGQRPMNALFARAVEMCHEKGMRYLVYGKFTYGNKTRDSMVEFKRRLGFESLAFRRYYVPLTLKGRVALKLGLDRGLTDLLPAWIIDPLLGVRARWLQRRRASGVDWAHATGES